MRCTVCHRPLTAPTATINSRGGPLVFGPDCARRAGLTPQATRKRVELFARIPRARQHRDQLPLDFQEEP